MASTQEEATVLYTGMNADRTCITVGTTVGFGIICVASERPSVIKHGKHTHTHTHTYNNNNTTCDIVPPQYTHASIHTSLQSSGGASG